LDLVTKFHNTIIFGTPDTILAQSFLGIQRNQRFARFQRRRLCDDVFCALADELGDFGAVFGTALKERNQEIGYKKHGAISTYRKRVCYFDDEFLKKKRRKYDLDCFLLPDFLGY